MYALFENVEVESTLLNIVSCNFKCSQYTSGVETKVKKKTTMRFLTVLSSVESFYLIFFCADFKQFVDNGFYSKL